MSFLRRRSDGTYHFRIRIPKDLQNCYNKRELVRSLATKNADKARELSIIFAMQVQTQFDKLRGITMADDLSRLLRQAGVNPLHMQELKIEGFKKDEAGNTVPYGVELDPNNIEKDTDALNKIIESGKATQNGLSASSKARMRKISEVVEDYCSEKRDAKRWTQKTEDENRMIYRLLTELVGDIPISQVTLDDVLDVKKNFQKLPANMKKDKLYREKSVARILAMKVEEKLSISTVNKYLRRCSALFNYAKRHSLVDENYFTGTRIDEEIRDDEKRAPFSTDELRQIFTRKCYIKHRYQNPYNFWAPLIALYSGMRLEEICQLHLEDIKMSQLAWVFDINKNTPDKSLKNKSAKRLVPIHAKLIELGLLDYRNRLEESGHERLFPELEKTSSKYGHAASNWFGRLRKPLGMVGVIPKKDFHSFRHTAIDFYKQLRTDEKHIDAMQIAAIMGHKHPQITLELYGARLAPPRLKNIVNLLNFDEAVGHLQPFSEAEIVKPLPK